VLQSSVSLGAAQLARAASLTEQLDAPSPAREAVLEGVRQRNAFLDFLFYDVKCVDADEAARIGPRWAAEGAILAVPPTGAGAFDLLAGHSKGNLVVSEALYALSDRDVARARALGASASIVTFSARIAMPSEFRFVIDVMGEWDWFGALNSRSSIPADRHVSQAWHHTNTELPWHLPVTPTLTDVLRG
jgi:hypothetical protein